MTPPKTHIMDVEVTTSIELGGERVYHVWFVAISGEQGPRLAIPEGLFLQMIEKANKAVENHIP